MFVASAELPWPNPMPLCEKKEPKVLPRKLPESAKSGLSSVPMPLPGRAKEAELGTNEAGMSMPKRESLPNCRDRVQLTPLESARKTRHAAKSPGRAVELVRFVLCIVPRVDRACSSRRLRWWCAAPGFAISAQTE